MATETKPTKVPRWNDGLANNTEPPEAKKDLGWVFQESPPSTWENWRSNLVGSWLKWIDERFDDGADENELKILDPSDGSDAIRIGANVIKIDHPLGSDGGIDIKPQAIQTLNVSPLQVSVTGQIFFDDVEFFATMIAGKSALSFDDGDRIQYNRTGNRYEFLIGGSEVFGVGVNGAEFGDPNFFLQYVVDNPRIVFDSTDLINYDRAADWLQFLSNSVELARVYETAGIPRLRLGPSAAGGYLILGSDPDSYLAYESSVLVLQRDGTGSSSGNNKRIEMAAESIRLADGAVGSWLFDFNDPLAGVPVAPQLSQGGGTFRISRAFGLEGHVRADFVHGHYDNDDPNGANLATIVNRNATLASARINPNLTGVPTLSQYHWNVASIVRSDIGVINVTLHEPIALTPVIQCTVGYTSSANFDKNLHAYGYVINSTLIQVYTYDGDNPHDYSPGEFIYFTAHGRPSTAPAP